MRAQRHPWHDHTRYTKNNTTLVTAECVYLFFCLFRRIYGYAEVIITLAKPPSTPRN